MKIIKIEDWKLKFNKKIIQHIRKSIQTYIEKQGESFNEITFS